MGNQLGRFGFLRYVRKMLSMFLSCWPQIKIPNKRQICHVRPGDILLSFARSMLSSALSNVLETPFYCPVTFFNWLSCRTGKAFQVKLSGKSKIQRCDVGVANILHNYLRSSRKFHQNVYKTFKSSENLLIHLAKLS